MSCAASAVMTEGITGCLGAGAEPEHFHQQLLPTGTSPLSQISKNSQTGRSSPTGSSATFLNMQLTAASSRSYGWVERCMHAGSGSSCTREKVVHTSGYRLLSFSGVTSTPLLATVATLVIASTSFISENTLAAAEATAITYTVFTSLYTTRYLPSRAL